MRVVEIFPSIQGEGPLIGTPSIFLRLAGCNLNCPWCDTPQKNEVNFDVPVANVVHSIRDLSAKKNIYNLVITGGEPMLQGGELQTLIRELSTTHITIETNGLRRNKFITPNLYVVSPKLNVVPVEELEEMCWWYQNESYNNVVYKFVVGSKEDMELVEKITHALTPSTGIFIQPKFPFESGIPEIMKNLKIIRNPVRVLPQAHKCLGIE